MQRVDVGHAATAYTVQLWPPRSATEAGGGSPGVLASLSGIAVGAGSGATRSAASQPPVMAYSWGATAGCGTTGAE